MVPFRTGTDHSTLNGQGHKQRDRQARRQRMNPLRHQVISGDTCQQKQGEGDQNLRRREFQRRYMPMRCVIGGPMSSMFANSISRLWISGLCR
jgi:hypothetical protein